MELAKNMSLENGKATQKKFDSLEEAEKWLRTEEYDFRTRSLVSKTYAKKIFLRRKQNGKSTIHK